jgi:hypothetical protein
MHLFSTKPIVDLKEVDAGNELRRVERHHARDAHGMAPSSDQHLRADGHGGGESRRPSAGPLVIIAGITASRTCYAELR